MTYLVILVKPLAMVALLFAAFLLARPIARRIPPGRIKVFLTTPLYMNAAKANSGWFPIIVAWIIIAAVFVGLSRSAHH